MRITREADYALRIILMLSREQKQIEAKVIAESNGIPYRFTLKILRKIVKAGIIRSYRGVNGGYILNSAPSDISVLDVVECIDGDIVLNPGAEDNIPCENNGRNKINACLTDVQDVLENEMSNITFDKILSRY
jgi:Rrf2 family protein